MVVEIKPKEIELLHRLAIKFISASLIFPACMIADDVRPASTIPVCTNAKVNGRFLSTGRLRYVVPKNAIVKKVKDIDYGEYRIFLKAQGRIEFMALFSWGNGSPYGLCSAEQHRSLRLPDGTEGVDARCTKGTNKESRSTGFESEYAYYDSVSSESVKYFDPIIDSMCYASPKN